MTRGPHSVVLLTNNVTFSQQTPGESLFPVQYEELSLCLINDSPQEMLLCFLSWMKHLCLNLLWTLERPPQTHAMLPHHRCTLPVCHQIQHSPRQRLVQVKVYPSQQKTFCGSFCSQIDIVYSFCFQCMPARKLAQIFPFKRSSFGLLY